jgi:diguanylate cyclase (GGDEF)-like protein/PAS domain S-box-containing protein
VQFQGVDAVLTAFTPINHLKLMEQRLELWAKVFEASTEGILIVDAERRILTVNRAFHRSTGHNLSDVIGERPEAVLAVPVSLGSPETLWSAVERRGSWQGEVRVVRRSGESYPAWLMVSAVRESGGALSYYICTSIDISDRKKSEERIRFLAEHDVLTELPNRSLCVERLRLALQQAARSGQRVAVLFIDLDRFKNINDSLGHHIGDGLLRSVAHRLQEAVRVGDTVSRQGGDEFVVVLNGVADGEEVAEIVEQRLIPLIRQPHQIDGAELHVSCSVGIAVYPDDGRDIDDLMRHADAAMYEAKAGGRNAARFFSEDMTRRAEARLRLEECLRHALANEEFRLVYQPRVAAASGALLGAEGLLRWHSPALGTVSPAQFIPVAEETGLIVPIGEWVIDEACRQMARWRRQGLRPLPLSINLSVVQLRDPGLVAALGASLQRHGVPPGTLEMEITESTLMANVEAYQDKLNAIRALGVLLSIDDFGTGYSSLNYLNRFPLDKLKIDRSFIHDMLDDPGALAITKAIIGLGHTLGLKVVAEGVETEQELKTLRAAGCDELQGYYFARPLTAEELVGWQGRRQPEGRGQPLTA